MSTPVSGMGRLLPSASASPGSVKGTDWTGEARRARMAPGLLVWLCRGHVGVRGAWAAALLVGVGVASGSAYDVVVPETTYSLQATDMSVASTALLDGDSVLMVYTEHPGGPVLGTTKFQVVNMATGAIELPPVSLPSGLRVATVAALAPDSAIIVLRDDNSRSEGYYFVVNPLTGAIVRGPTLFAPDGTSWEYRVAAADPFTVLIAYRSEGLWGQGKFIVVDPTNGAVVVPETAFEPMGINTVDVVALDPERVVIAYQRPEPGNRSFFTAVDPHTGATLLPARRVRSQLRHSPDPEGHGDGSARHVPKHGEREPLRASQRRDGGDDSTGDVCRRRADVGLQRVPVHARRRLGVRPLLA